MEEEERKENSHRKLLTYVIFLLICALLVLSGLNTSPQISDEEFGKEAIHIDELPDESTEITYVKDGDGDTILYASGTKLGVFEKGDIDAVEIYSNGDKIGQLNGVADTFWYIYDRPDTHHKFKFVPVYEDT